MPNINVSELVNDPDFGQSYTVQRSTGAWALGGFQSTVSSISRYGVIEPAGEKELMQVPEGDRVSGAIVIYDEFPLYMTHVSPAPGLSDVINWQGDNYRVAKVTPWQNYGYYEAIAVRMTGN